MTTSTRTDGGRRRRRVLALFLVLGVAAVLVTPAQWALAYYLFERERRRRGDRPPGRGPEGGGARPPTGPSSPPSGRPSPGRRRDRGVDRPTPGPAA